MSRVGKRPIVIPEKTEIRIAEGSIVVKGPLGELSRRLHPHVEINIADSTVTVAPKVMTPAGRALWGTYAAHIANMVEGVQKPYVKKLILEGVGYRVALTGQSLTFNIGFSHPVVMPIPHGLTAVVEKNEITVSGIDKEQVGQFAADLHALKKPEPYKGKGIRYAGEVILRKQGKKAA
jgi:large subunit ribosomal protein L6